MPTLGGPIQPATKLGVVRRSRTGRRLGMLAFQFQQHGPQQLVVGDASQEGGFRNRADEYRNLAALEGPAEPLP